MEPSVPELSSNVLADVIKHVPMRRVIIPDGAPPLVSSICQYPHGHFALCAKAPRQFVEFPQEDDLV